jgi:mono/diheme cytochrome c family protein
VYGGNGAKSQANAHGPTTCFPGAPMRRTAAALFLAGIFSIACEEAADPAGGGEAEASTSGDPTNATSGAEASSTGGEAVEVTYWQDIKPIVDAKCGSCHTPDGIAPFPLGSYDDLVEYMPLGAAAIHAGTMPPWQPADGCNEYRGDRSLDQEHIDLIDAWIAEEMPEGDPANEGAPLVLDTPTLSRVDLELGMPETYVPTQAPDDYRCFLLDWPHEETKYVTGFRAVPGNTAIVHHVIAFLADADARQEYVDLDAAEEGPGYTCFGGTGGSANTWIGGWAPGGQGADLPDGLGIEVEPGSTIVLQVHYNALDTNADPDLTGIELKIDDSVQKVATVQPFANPAWIIGNSMNIPAGNPDVEHVFEIDPGTSFSLHTAALHMHLLGRSGRLSIERADGSSQCVLAIDDYDFGWQTSYALTQPINVNAGDRLRLECHHDNSPENQPLVNGERPDPIDVQWGEGTRDEMCLGVFLASAQ